MISRRTKIARSVKAEYLLQAQIHGLKISATRDEILSGIDTDIKDRASNVRVSLKSADEDSNKWEFESSSGHMVKIKSDPRVPVDDLNTADVLVSCSCPFWQYNGPEYHAQQGDYLHGVLQGTATKPERNDPDMNNYVCKHAYKALKTMF
jgi:hypothetical protein